MDWVQFIQGVLASWQLGEKISQAMSWAARWITRNRGPELGNRDQWMFLAMTAIELLHIDRRERGEGIEDLKRAMAALDQANLLPDPLKTFGVEKES